MPSPLTRLRDREFYSPPSDHHPAADRFIPTRTLMDLGLARSSLYTRHLPNNAPDFSSSSSSAAATSPSRELYRRWVEENLTTGPDGKPFRMLPFRSPGGCRRSLRLVDRMLEEAKELERPAPALRRIRMVPEMVLDAPGLVDDYYLNLMDWGKENILAMALGPGVYLWKEDSTSIHNVEELLQRDQTREYPTSVAWSCDGKKLAVGFGDSAIEVWDIQQLHRIRTFHDHTDRVGSLSWNDNILTSGSRDTHIFNYDVRSGKVMYHLQGHVSEVCGLKWSPDGTKLATGANDNIIHIWESNLGPTRSLHRLTDHTAAIRALAWSPLQMDRLASGGGTRDCCIKIWNTQNGDCTRTIETGSQVCALEWNRHQNEILSAHGYSKNQLSLWAYPSMRKLADLQGHQSRVLQLSQNPDGSTVASASPDETVRIWKIFEPPSPSKKACDDDSVLSLKRLHIR